MKPYVAKMDCEVKKKKYGEVNSTWESVFKRKNI